LIDCFIKFSVFDNTPYTFAGTRSLSVGIWAVQQCNLRCRLCINADTYFVDATSRLLTAEWDAFGAYVCCIVGVLA